MRLRSLLGGVRGDGIANSLEQRLEPCGRSTTSRAAFVAALIDGGLEVLQANDGRRELFDSR